MKSLLPCLLLACLSTTATAATEVLPLGYRTADEIMPIAESVIAGHGTVSAYRNQLVISASPEVIEEVKRVLGELDTPPKELLITVATGEVGAITEDGYRVNGEIDAGGVSVGTDTQGRDGIRIIRRSTSSQGDGVQQVRTTEGYPALIEVGETVPMTTTVTDGYGQIYQHVEPRDVTRGFYATATVVGERVQVVLSSQRERIDSVHPDTIDRQRADTRVSGRLGEWIYIGGVGEQRIATDRGTLRRYSTQSEDDFGLRLKVEVIE
ncbi:secretin N-terminal domain-containing protein [Stutzerimonas urumqiensis]|uniref:secretin N-terminal domain-containing protein n=1 Tax=Stutzerimonas urumqiensis TaxID=638269 RepID=UPI000EB3DDA1|nr:secretin N-terminal domain-containing protein [Stutzerimonas urumqiensis]